MSKKIPASAKAISLIFLFLFPAVTAPVRALVPAGNVGVFGGSFDPPTLAHKEIIETAIDKYNLRKLYLLLNLGGQKNYKASASEREAMLRLMLGVRMEKITFIPLILTDKKNEINRRLKAREGADKLYVFMGQD
ncbi:MAG: hypothetical protein ABIG11_07290, partial [bacterium]